MGLSLPFNASVLVSVTRVREKVGTLVIKMKTGGNTGKWIMGIMLVGTTYRHLNQFVGMGFFQILKIFPHHSFVFLGKSEKNKLRIIKGWRRASKFSSNKNFDKKNVVLKKVEDLKMGFCN